MGSLAPFVQLALEVEPSNPLVSFLGPVIGLAIAGGGWLLTRRGQDKTGADAFRDDLLERIAQLEKKAEASDAKAVTTQTRLDRLQTENDRLWHRLAVITEWGINAPGSPPRVPPEWLTGGGP